MSKYEVKEIQVNNPHKNLPGQPDTITQFIVVDERGRQVAGPFESLEDADEKCDELNSNHDNAPSPGM